MTGETLKHPEKKIIWKYTSRKYQHDLLLDIYNNCSVIWKETRVLKIICHAA